MVASVGPSYNVLSLFQKPEGSAAAADTAAADAIIETIQQMKSDTSPARLQGASAATQAWIESAPVAAASEVKPAEADASAAGASAGGTNAPQRDASGRLKGISAEQKALIANMYEQAERVREKMYAVLVDLEAAGLGDKTLLDKADFEQPLVSGSGSGGGNIRSILEWATTFNMTSKHVKALDAGTATVGQTTAFKLEKSDISGDWSLSSEVPVVDEERLADTIEKFNSANYFWYESSSNEVQRSLSDIKDGRYDVSGDVLIQNDDGSYRAGIFSVKSLTGSGFGGNNVIIEHDGSGTAKVYNIDGSYSKIDLVASGLWG